MDATSTRPYAMPALLTACLVSGSHLRAIWEQVSSHDGFIHWACGRADVCGGSVDPEKTMRAREADTIDLEDVSVSQAIEIKNKSYEDTRIY